MMGKFKIRIVLLLIGLVSFLNLLSQAKIVGLVPVRNEDRMIVPCLKALAMYTDAIVVLDDASEDGTVAAVQALQQECKVERIIAKKTWYRDEPGDRNLLLQAGREIGGTHFIVIDADEMFTANLSQDNLLRNKILALQPGERLRITWINLWRSVDAFRYDDSSWSREAVDAIFCDDGNCFYSSDFIHTSRSPSNLPGVRNLVLDNQSFSFLNSCLQQLKRPIFEYSHQDRNSIFLQRYLIDRLHNDQVSLKEAALTVGKYFQKDGFPRWDCYRNDFTAGLMHFQFVNWDNLLAKQAWYRCLEKIRNPAVDIDKINKLYGHSKQENGLRTLSCPLAWFAGYDFFDKSIYEQNHSWQKQQVQAWFKEYGKEFFRDLDIWDVNWE